LAKAEFKRRKKIPKINLSMTRFKTMKTVKLIRVRNPTNSVFVKNTPKKRPLTFVLLAKPNVFALNA
jgi:hypothetical protein